MARLPRLYAPGLPQLVQANFIQPLAAASQPAPADILNQLATWLGESAQRHRVSVHGWLLANDRILLLATPADEEGLPRLMQTLGRNLAARLRGGRVFAGRYRSALLEPGAWVLPALVWLETYPVRSGASQPPSHISSKAFLTASIASRMVNTRSISSRFSSSMVILLYNHTAASSSGCAFVRSGFHLPRRK